MLGSKLIITKNNHCSVTHVRNKKMNSKYKHLTHFLRTSTKTNINFHFLLTVPCFFGYLRVGVPINMHVGTITSNKQP